MMVRALLEARYGGKIDLILGNGLGGFTPDGSIYELTVRAPS